MKINGRILIQINQVIKAISLHFHSINKTHQSKKQKDQNNKTVNNHSDV